MSTEGRDAAVERMEVVQDILQPITNMVPTIDVLNVKGASEHGEFDQKLGGHAVGDDNNDEAGGANVNPANEQSGRRESMGTGFTVRILPSSIMPKC
jgi:hypothetical protein